MAPVNRTANVVTPNIIEGSSVWQLITAGAGDLPYLYRSIICTVSGTATFVDAAGTQIIGITCTAGQEVGPYLRPTKITSITTAVLYGLL